MSFYSSTTYITVASFLIQNSPSILIPSPPLSLWTMLDVLLPAPVDGLTVLEPSTLTNITKKK